ncbi:unnamed protein product [Brassica napus]|uniref:(rape) hypothetical protein n=1 Tax=Brassica napus TaxID=3708 RepID=A0A817AVS3_BRANA|nr:unnamed protein product [Brassica napus]
MMLLLSLVSVPPVWSLRHLLVVLLWVLRVQQFLYRSLVFLVRKLLLRAVGVLWRKGLPLVVHQKTVPPSKSRKIVCSDVELPFVVDSPAVEKASFEPFDHSFNGLASRCGDLLLLFQSPGGVDGLCFDQVRRGEWCQGFACHLAIVR